MSGIVGLIRWDGQKVSRGLVCEMAEKICHRGPDGITFLDRGTLSVGFLKFNVTHESIYESQPLTNARGDVLVADARIDNRAQLLEQLQLGGDTTQIPDSRLIMAAYEKWHTDCLDYLIGDFAFVIWNAERQALFCARDHSGVRPFFYHHLPGSYLLFASEIKALWAFEHLSKEICEPHLANYLTHWGQFNIYQHTTFYKGVNSLPPAHRLTVDEQTIRTEIYWKIDSEKYQYDNEEAYLQAFEDTFLEAVSCRLRSPYPVSSFLSGGLDSSSVAAIAVDLLQKEGKLLNTYYIDTQLEETSEREYVKAFQEKYAINHREVTLEGDYYENLLRVAEVTDMPEMFSLNYNHFAPIVRSVSQAGSRILLTGSDGDTVVGYGFDYVHAAMGRGDWREVTRCLNLAHALEAYQAVYGKKEGKWIRSKNIVSLLLTKLPLLFGRFRTQLEFLIGAVYYLKIPPMHLVRIFLEKFSRRALEIDDYSVDPKLLEQCIPFMQEGPQQHPTTNLLMNRGMLYQMMTEISEYYDLMGARHQVQICHPFFDKRLIELCMFVPSKLKFYEGYGRGPLRAAMRTYLPDKILYRKGKVDFTTYIHKHLAELEINPFAVIEENNKLLEGYVVTNKPKDQLLAEDKKTRWNRLHHRILYFLHWRKAQGI